MPLLASMKKHDGLFLILAVIFFIFTAGFSPSSWLTGWDNLHPEFNFSLNINRSLFAVWQEYQGLGLVGGMGHASDLFRQLFIFVLSLFFPLNWLRQVWLYLSLLTGALGMYFFLRFSPLSPKPQNFMSSFFLPSASASLPPFISAVGALFYCLNLAAVQAFYTPFAPFITQFAFLPWLILFLSKFIDKPDKKNLIFFTVANFLALPQAYVPTVFFVYLGAVLIIILFQKRRLLLPRVLAIIFAVNAFWLLPFTYFSLTNLNVAYQSKINQIATPDIFQRNKEAGNFLDIVLMKGFWFYTLDLQNNSQQNLMGVWKTRLNNPFIAVIGIAFFAVIAYGLFSNRRQKHFLPFLILYLFTFCILASDTFPFSVIDSLIYRLPLIREVFRSPFTKFSLLFSFLSAVFFAFGLQSLTRKISPKIHLAVPAAALILLVIFSLPVFSGNLVYPKLLLKIPSDYFQLFTFLDKQNPHARLAGFPQNTFWGWQYYSWGYRGSGFLWYGINQPVLDRAFDVWNKNNENYYWEISYALYSKNPSLFYDVLNKYQISFLLLDGNIISPDNQTSLYYRQFRELVKSLPQITPAGNFGKISLYRVNLKIPVNNFVFLIHNPPNVAPGYRWNNLDRAFNNTAGYLNGSPPDYYYPFRSLFTNKTVNDEEVNLLEDKESFLLTAPLPPDSGNYVMSALSSPEMPLINPRSLSVENGFKPEILFKNQKISVRIPKIAGYLSASALPPPENRELKTQNGSYVLDLPFLDHQYSYLLSVNSRNLSGRSLYFWLEDPVSKKADLETYLPANQTFQKSFFIIPPMDKGGAGYVLHFENRALGRENPRNILSGINLHLFPYNYLTSLRFAKTGAPKTSYEAVSTAHPFPFLYETFTSPADNSSYLVLSQSYDKGWRAYEISKSHPAVLAPLFGKKLAGPLPVNNWENGWKIEGLTDKKIVVVYLPQYLEFLGFIIFFVLLIIMFLPTPPNNIILKRGS